jgi:hypothetical protein
LSPVFLIGAESLRVGAGSRLAKPLRSDAGLPPSMFVTLTCHSYGKIGPDGAPADPDSYDYQRAARDALHFAALFDRLIQSLRRFLGQPTHRASRHRSVRPRRRGRSAGPGSELRDTLRADAQ